LKANLIRQDDIEPVPNSEIDVFSEVAMNNAYSICHNVQVKQVLRRKN
jgi:hypothetical protein